MKKYQRITFQLIFRGIHKLMQENFILFNKVFTILTQLQNRIKMKIIIQNACMVINKRRTQKCTALTSGKHTNYKQNEIYKKTVSN